MIFQNKDSEINMVRNKISQLNQKLSSLDKQLSEHYHALEVAELTHVSIGHKIAKSMQQVLRQRRLLKEELVYQSITLSMMENVNKKIKDRSIKLKEDRDRSLNSLKSILEK